MTGRLPEILDAAAMVSIAAGFGYRFGWWLAAVVLGVLVIASNWARSR